MAPLLMLIDSSRQKRIAKRESKIYSGGNEKTGNVQLRYREDIMLWVYSLLVKTMWFLGICVGTPAYHPGFLLCIQFMIPRDRREST
jgi:hypothetical protein